MATFEWEEMIGSGGFGDVFKGKCLEDGVSYAKKQLSRPDEEDVMARFRREVRLVEKLSHKNIVPIIESHLDDNPPWYVMPLALHSLRDIIKIELVNDTSCGPIIYQIASGLCHAHNSGVIHRDLKPENILFFKDDDESYYAAISDFGIGRFTDRDTLTITQDNIGMGTFFYAAPEQLTDTRSADRRADIYALGKIIYELLTNETPYPNLDINKIPGKYIYIITRCCDEDPSRRYQSVEELIQDLNSLSEGDRLLTRPAELIKQEVRNILEELEYKDDRIENILRIFSENLDDREFLLDSFPNLMRGLLRKIIIDHPSEFYNIFTRYDNAVSGNLPFSYCDSVAAFYKEVFDLTKDRRIRVIILTRLPSIGYSHNRWHVGNVFASIVATLDPDHPDLIFEVAKILKGNKSMAGWCKEYLDKHSLPKLIRDAYN